MSMDKRTVTIWPGYELDRSALQRLYRERWLKVTQVEMCRLTGVKQPNLASHEIGTHPLDSVDAAFDAVGFKSWASSVATCDEEASMIEDMLTEDSGAEWMPGPMWKQLEEMREKKRGAA